MDWKETIGALEESDGKKRQHALNAMLEYVQSHSLSRQQMGELNTTLGTLLEDKNTKICQTSLQILNCLATNGSKEHLKIFAPGLLSSVVERLGDTRQAVRQDACSAILSVGINVCGVSNTLERVWQNGAWGHKNWRVKHGVLSVAAELISKMQPGQMSDIEKHRLVIAPTVNLLDDPNSSVRDAAMECFEELYKAMGDPFLESLGRYTIRPAQMKEIKSRLSEITCHVRHTVDTTATVAQPPVKEKNPKNEKTRRKRGGYMDGGGVTGSGGALPFAEAIHLKNEHELKIELEKIGASLGSSTDWDRRIDALVRLEGLMKGGAASFDACVEMLKGLRDPLTAQVNDRRSAVSRQACHVLGLMSTAFGEKYEMMAVFFLPVLFKVLIITVQVMSDAAETCIHTILHHCQTWRIAPKICDVLINDKSAKMRQHCIKYLLQVLETWPAAVYEKNMECIENALRAAAQDAISETKSIGRLAFGAYHTALPERSRSFLKKLDGAMQQKLSQAVTTYRPGTFNFPLIPPLVPEVSVQSKAVQPKAVQPKAVQFNVLQTPIAARTSLPAKVTPVRDAPSSFRKSMPHILAPIAETTPLTGFRPGTSSEVGHLSAEAAWKLPQSGGSAPGWTGTPHVLSKSCKLPPKRISCILETEEDEYEGGQGDRSTHRKAQRCLVYMATPSLQSTPNAGPPNRLNFHSLLQNVEDEEMEESNNEANDDINPINQINHTAELSQNAMHDDSYDSGTATKGLSILKLLAMAGEKGRDWRVKLSTLDRMRQCFEGSSTVPEIANVSDRLAVFFQTHLEDPHFKVVQSSLNTMSVALLHIAPVLEPYIDRLMPQLFQKVVDQKDVIRKAAQDTLEGCACQYRADALLLAMIRSLEVTKVARSHAAILEYSCIYIGQQKKAGAPETPAVIRQWVCRLCSLLTDKNAELRKLAVNSLENVYKNMDPSTLLFHISQASPQEQLTLRRVLGPLIPQIVPESPSQHSSHHNTPAKDSSALYNNEREAAKKLELEKDPEIINQMHRESSTQSCSTDTKLQQPTPPARPSSHSKIPKLSTFPEASTSSVLSDRGHSEVQHNVLERRTLEEISGNNCETVKSVDKGQGSGMENEIKELLSAMEGEVPSVGALQQLLTLIKEGQNSDWKLYCNRALSGTLNVLNCQDSAVKEQTLVIIRAMLIHHSTLLENSIVPNIVSQALKCTRDSVGLVVIRADEVLEAVSLQFPPEPTISIFSHTLKDSQKVSEMAENGDPMLRYIIRNTSRCFSRLNEMQILDILPGELMNGILEAWNGTRVDVRKAVVCCLAELCARLGERLTPFLTPLSASQLKLLELYVNKAKKSLPVQA